MSRFKGVVIRQDVMWGQPCIAGTRRTTASVMGAFMRGESLIELCREDYSLDQIENAIRFEILHGEEADK